MLPPPVWRWTLPPQTGVPGEGAGGRPTEGTAPPAPPAPDLVHRRGRGGCLTVPLALHPVAPAPLPQGPGLALLLIRGIAVVTPRAVPALVPRPAPLPPAPAPLPGGGSTPTRHLAPAPGVAPVPVPLSVVLAGGGTAGATGITAVRHADQAIDGSLPRTQRK